MIFNENKKNMESEGLIRVQDYLRSQARLTRDMDWLGEQAEITDDGTHPLLEDCEPRYSRQVMRRAFATWVQLDNKNPFKFLCKYYHALDKMSPTAPPHMQKFIEESLQVPADCANTVENIFSDTHNEASSLPYKYNLNSRPCFYKHCDSDRLYLKTSRTLENAQTAVVKYEGRQEPTNVYELYCKSLAYKLYGPQEKTDAEEKEPSAEQAATKMDSPKILNRSIVSLENTPSKSSEHDSCYQSLCSPITDQEEDKD